MAREQVQKPRRAVTKRRTAREGDQEEQQRSEVREDVRRLWWPEA